MSRTSLKTRITIVLYILSFTISLFIFYFLMDRVSIDVELTTHSKVAVDGGNIYYSQNLRKDGVIFKMGTNGRVTKMFRSGSINAPYILELSTYGGDVYAVVESFDEEEDSNGGIISTPIYRIISLDSKLNLNLMTEKFKLPDEELVSGFSAESTGLYITTITKDGKSVRVYSIDQSNLKDPKETGEGEARGDILRSKDATEGRFFADALYKAGDLYVRTDKDTPSGVFETDTFVKSVVSNMKLSTGQLFSLYSNYIIAYIAVLLIWFILLYLLIRVFEKRNRSFYYILIAEGLVFILTLAATFTISANYESAREVEHSRFAVISLIGLSDEAGLTENLTYTEDFYDSDRYRQISTAISDFAKRDGNSAIFYDVFVYRLQDEMTVASASGMNNQFLDDIYGSEMADIAPQIYKGNQYTAHDFSIEGQDYRAIAVTVDPLNPKYALVGIINDTTEHMSVFVDNQNVFILFLISFAIASALVVLVWRLHMRDLSVLEEALSETALGGEIPERPIIIGADIKDMWDSTAEIHKKIDEIEYTKIRILEAYYRFAPKNVEKILSKKSIIEVENSDATEIFGTIGTINLTLKGSRKITRIDRIVDSMGEYQKEHNSIVVGKAPDMSNFELLFMENEKECVKAFIDILSSYYKSYEQSSISALLYYDRCKFGVIGSEVEATTYLRSNNQQLMYRISAFVQRYKLGIVITGQVKEREKITSPLRFIGYAGEDKNGEMIELYEVLDCLSAVERRQKISTLNRYEEALRLFYEKDFYIARTKFSEILKDTPEDTLIKFYIFESDRYLNENVEGQQHKILNL